MTGSARSFTSSQLDAALEDALPAGPVPSGLVEMVDRPPVNEGAKGAADPSSAIDGGPVPPSLLEEIEAAMSRPATQGTVHDGANSPLEGGAPPQWLIRDVEGG